MKKFALFSLVIFALIIAWGIQTSNVVIMLNGKILTGPLAVMAGGWGIVISSVVMFCVAILLTLVLAGVGLVVLGAMVLAGFILLAAAFPFLLPLLLPLLIVWAFIAGTRKTGEK